MASPQPQTLSFHKLVYTVPQLHRSCCTGGADARKTVLHGISGIFRPGTLTGVLGSSGSGKTSLLDILSVRMPSEGRLTGQVLLNGAPMTETLVRQYCGYVMQDDYLLPTLTVKENLTYVAQMRNADEATSSSKGDRITTVLQELGLAHVADHRIGDVNHKGISGGERRRVSIAVQLLLNPSVIFLDEPTSGLDAFTANSIMATLAQLARAGRTVICTVHQPRSDIFAILDAVLLLSQGKIVYSGTARDMVAYFAAQGHSCPTFMNPADYAIDISTVDERTTDARQLSTKRLAALVTAFSASSKSAALQRDLDEETRRMDATPLFLVAEQRVAWLTIVKILVARQSACLRRDANALFSRLGQLVMFGVLMSLFIGRLNTEQYGVQNRTGLLFETVSGAVFIGSLNGIALFTTQRNLFYRERRDGLYSAGQLVASYTIHALPFDCLSAAFFSFFAYWVMGLQDHWDRFGVYLAVVTVLHNFGEGITMVLLAVFYDFNMANNVVSLIISVAALVAGLLRSNAGMPQVLQWLSYVSIFKYGAEMVVQNEFSDLPLVCPPEPAPCVYPSGEAYIQSTFPDASERWVRNSLLLVAFAFIVRPMAVLVLHFRRVALR